MLYSYNIVNEVWPLRHTDVVFIWRRLKNLVYYYQQSTKIVLVLVHQYVHEFNTNLNYYFSAPIKFPTVSFYCFFSLYSVDNYISEERVFNHKLWACTNTAICKQKQIVGKQWVLPPRKVLRVTLNETQIS